MPTILPPFTPPNGPRSIIWSAVLITSRLCSITITVFPSSTSVWRILSKFLTSSKWRPVVGSSSIYNVFPVDLFDNSFDNFILCASPPDKVVADWPIFI